MSFLYVFIAFILGALVSVGSMYLAVVMSRWTAENEPKKPPEPIPEEPMQAAQFVEPVPLEERIKDGTTLDEIIN